MSSRTSGCSPATPSSFASAAGAPVHPTVNIERFSVALTCWVLMLAAPAFAQGIAGGLFGATRSDESGRDRLNVQASMAGGLDSEVPPEAGSLVPPGDLPSGGRSTMLAASADYARNRRSVQLFGTASTYFRYAPGPRSHRHGKSERTAGSRCPPAEPGDSEDHSIGCVFSLLSV